jgi:HEAT repeat protein
LLSRRRPAGAAEVLLAYLPYADDETVLKEVQTALAAVAVREGKLDPALIRALEDRVAVRRAVAAEVLVGTGGAEQWAAVRPLLRDPRPLVRLRVALALAQVRVEEAIPVLIALLGELPPEQARLAEDHLKDLAADQAPKVELGTDESSRLKCRAAWTAWWNKYEGAALLDEFRKRTLTDEQREKILALIRRLGDEEFAVREKASAELLAIGKPALFLLRQAVTDADPEISQRSQKCVQALESGAVVNLPLVAARLVALRKPPGAAEALLAFVPFADDETTGQEVQTALAALAFRHGKPDSALLRALDDRVGLRRAAAAEALCQAGSAEQWPLLRKLLTDSDAAVRLRVALALASAGDREGVPALIALLTELPADQAWRAEDGLLRVLGEQAPRIPLGTDAAGRQKCRDGWAAWWKEQGPKVELARLDGTQRLLGYTLLVQTDNNGTGKVMELGAGGKIRWALEGLQFPVDAHLVSGNRVLVTEYNGMRITERDLKGNVIWERRINDAQPVNAQRLPNGNTFIATENQCIELDRAGKEVFAYNRNQGDILSACKTRDGQVVCLLSRGMILRLDATGKELKSFSVGNVNYTSGLDVLPNGRVLVPLYNAGRVVEFDFDGKRMWEAAVQRPTSATRLPNGNTLVASNSLSKLVELDRNGKVVWEYKDGGRPWRARRR